MNLIITGDYHIRWYENYWLYQIWKIIGYIWYEDQKYNVA